MKYYDYKMLSEDIERLCGMSARVELFSIGKSVMGKPIYCIKIGQGERRLFLNAAHHGLEYLTSAMLMKFADKYITALERGERIGGCKAKSLYDRTTLYIVPMVNPDGVDLAIHGIRLDNKYHAELVRRVGILPFDRVWQANIRGVDINHNYNAMWQSVEKQPSATKYSGPYPESEEETKAMVSFTKSAEFDMVIAFHSQGREIYYDFNGLTAPNSYYMAQQFADVSGYKAAVPQGSAGFGGYKDWFINEFGKAGFTIEIGYGKNPLGMDLLEEVFGENLPIIVCAMAEC